MKRLIFLVSIFAVSFQVSSQIRKGVSPYRFSQDMYLGANIGQNAFLADGYSEYGLKGCFGLSKSVYIGYNFLEILGVKVSGAFNNMVWPGITSSGLNNNPKKFSTMSINFDILFNISNYFDRFNLRRPFDFQIFAGTGFINREKSTFLNEYFGMVYKAGFQADYRLNYKFDLNASFAGNIVSEQFNEYTVGRNFDAFPELMLGLTYHIRN